MHKSISNKQTLIFILFISIVVSLVYYPGLYGDYVFDDSANILNNKKLAIDSLSWQELKSAALSGDAGPLGRPISVVSFALNYYFSGFDPFYFKLTNLAIHIVNTLLIFFISKFIISSFVKLSPRQALWGAFSVAIIWGVHPLNLTSVLYVVQRMVSLSTMFGLLALYTYVKLRTKESLPSFRSSLFHSCLVAAFILAAMLSKESGVLFIPLIIIVELFVFKGKSQGQDLRVGKFRLFDILIGTVVLATLLVLLKVPDYMNPAVFRNRDFNAVERLLSEARVLFYYLKLFLFPRLTDLSLYHDDIVVSRSLIEPVTTLISVVALVAISAICLIWIRKTPILLFSWCWFLIGHALESTVISLELVHEHRNYFAILGLLFVAPYIYFKVPRLFKPLVLVVGVVYTAYLGFTTWQRAVVWSNLVDHASFEATYHPESGRANYQAARVYMKLMDLHEDEPEERIRFSKLAAQSLADARKSYRPDNAAWLGQLHLDYYLGSIPNPELIEGLKSRLNAEPFYNNNIGLLSAFMGCQIKGHCKMPHHEAVAIVVSAIENPAAGSRAKAELFKLLARYFAEVAGDFNKAEEFLLEALSLVDDINGNLLLTQIYRGFNYPEMASIQLDKAKKLDQSGIWAREIEHEQQMIDNAKNN